MSLELRGVGFSYLPGTPLAREVLRDINLEVAPGELLCLLGPSGSGKSTIAQILNGLLAPGEGQLFLDGKAVSGDVRELRSLRRRVGLVFQNPERQLFAETVEADISFGPRQHGLSRQEAARSAAAAAKLLDLDYEELAQRSPFSLSFGQRRRVAIAGVLALEPDYLVLDEPAAGLDPAGRNLMLGLVSKLRDQGHGLVMITHNLEDAMRMADRVLLLREGSQVAAGPTGEILADGRLLGKAGYSLPALLSVLQRLAAGGVQVPVFARTPAEAARMIAEALGGKGGVS